MIANDPEVIEAIRDRRLVAFVGAGLSRPFAPDWDALSKTLAQECELEAGASDGLSNPQLIDLCIEKSEVKCNEVLKKEFPSHKAVSRRALLYILRLPFRALLTTNFDPWLRQGAEKGKYCKVHTYPDLPLPPFFDALSPERERPRIFYVHGLFDEKNPNSSIRSLVLGEKSFDEAYRDSLLSGFLLNMFTYQRIMFFGFNLLESHTARLLQNARRIRAQIAAVQQRQPPPLWHYSWQPLPQDDKPERRRIEVARLSKLLALDVKPLVYDARDEDYTGLEEELFDLVGQCAPDDAPPPIASGFEVDYPLT